MPNSSSVSSVSSVVPSQEPGFDSMRTDLTRASRALLLLVEVTLSLLLLVGAAMALERYSRVIASQPCSASDRVLVGSATDPMAHGVDRLARA